MGVSTGTLEGVRVIEFAAIGPVPYAGMLLADHGADVIRIDRPGAHAEPWNLAGRGKRSIQLDLKTSEGRADALALTSQADVLMEGHRPGVMERLALGPTDVHAVNPALVYGRMTGWGQVGPLSRAAGHDINYLSVAGGLHGIGDPSMPPRPAQNFVADFGGGSMFLLFGMLSALLHARRTGQGQVVDAAMVDGAASLTTVCHGRLTSGAWVDERGQNILDGSAPFYATYECADGKYIAFGAGEPQFTDLLLAGLGLTGVAGVREHWYDRAHWPRLRRVVAGVVARHDRIYWLDVFGESDACVAPVLSLREAPAHPHMSARDVFVEIDGVLQPAPAPRFSGTPGRIAWSNPAPGVHAADIRKEFGIDHVSDRAARLEVEDA